MKRINIFIFTFIFIVVLTVNTAALTGYITGTVFYNNKRLENVDVKLVDLNISTETDEAGNFRFKDVPVTYESGPHKVVLNHKDFKEKEAKVYVDHNRLMILNSELKAKPGKIYGKTIPETIIKINDYKIKANKEGEFELKGIEPGEYKVEFNHPDYFLAKRKVTVPVNDEVKFEQSLKPKLASLEGYTLDGSTVEISGNNLEIKDGYFNVKELEPGKYQLKIKKTGYIPYKKEYNLQANENINLGNIDMDLKKYVKTYFQEDAWLGAYFLNKNLKNHEKYYPYLNIRKRNLYKKDPDSIFKLILSDYIIAQNTEILKEIGESNIKTGEDLSNFIKKLREKDELLVDRELYLLTYLKNEVEKNFNILKNYSGYKYRFYHFKLNQEKKKKEYHESLFTTEKMVKELASKNQQFPIGKEMFKESRNTTQVINNMLPGEYEKLINYIESPLVSLNNDIDEKEDVLKNARISYIDVNFNDISSITTFFSLFKKKMIKNEDLKLDEWLMWEEINK